MSSGGLSFSYSPTKTTSESNNQLSQTLSNNVTANIFGASVGAPYNNSPSTQTPTVSNAQTKTETNPVTVPMSLTSSGAGGTYTDPGANVLEPGSYTGQPALTTGATDTGNSNIWLWLLLGVGAYFLMQEK